MTETLIRLERELLKGAQTSLPGKQGLAIELSLNVLGHEKSIQPFPGVRRLLNSPVTTPITGMISLLIGGVPTLFFGTADKLYKFTRSGGVEEVGTGYTGTNLTPWSFARWGNWVVASNGVDVVQIDKADTNDMVALGGTPPTNVLAIVPWRNLLVVFTKDEIFWSDFDDPEVWTSALTNFAGDLPARDVLSGIKTALPLGDLIAYYTGDEMRALAYVGPTNIFGQGAVLKGIGSVGTHAICSANKMHFGWGPKGRWVTDGSSYRMIDNPDMKDYIESNFNRDAAAGIVAWEHPEIECVIFSYPSEDSVVNDLSIAIQHPTDSWWPLNFGRTAVNTDSAFGYPIAGDADGDVWEMPVEHALAGNVTSVGLPLAMSESGYLIFQHLETAYGDAVFGTVPSGEIRTF